MEENISQANPPDFEKQNSPKSKRFWFVLIAFLAIILLIGGFVVWTSYLSPEAKSERETRLNYEKATKALSDYETAMKNDTYGGKTPQETLNLFVDALKKGDIELASKYFVRNGAGQIDSKWIEALMKTKEAGKLQDVINLLLKAKPAGSSMEGYFGFEVRDASGELINDINMIVNRYSGIWKIESL